jgi:MFS family permease
MAVILALIFMGAVPQERTLAGVQILRKLDFRSSIREGLSFVFRHPIIFPSMLLDFFATFFSTAAALLPIFAKDILSVGPVGYGWLVAAPSVGAGLVAIILAFRRALGRQGTLLFIAVASYGLATVLFGLSRVFWLTYLALAFTGGTDMLSMVIRNTIRQLQTPDNLRGRMTSINQIFFAGGPELGELEAGLVAQWLGPIFAVVSGGIGCLLAVGVIAARSPQLRRYRGDEPIIAGQS